MDDIIPIWHAILATLKEMGTASVQEGEPYGLRGYPDCHRKLFPGSFRKCACEEPLMAGIELGLKSYGFQATTKKGELRYPAGGYCDLIIGPDSSSSIWIEFKTACRQHLAESSPGSQYRYKYDGVGSYDPGRGRDSWVSGVLDIGRKDVPKLLSLSPLEAKYIGVLLLGFDRVTDPLTNRELYELLPKGLCDWKSAHDSKEGVTWDDSYPLRKERGFRERIWFWYRLVI